jgi:hypothetical protein
MPHDLLAAPFLGQYLLLRPGSTAGVHLPAGYFGQLAQAAAAGGSYPPWLAGLARQAWQLQLPETAPVNGRVLVREESPYGYGRASWEINLGCNYACSHCYLGLKEFSGLPWAGKERLLRLMRDAGVVWLQITGGCFRTRRVPQGTCLIRLSSAVARNLLSGLCRGAVRGRRRAGAGVVAQFGCAGLRAGRLPVS